MNLKHLKKTFVKQHDASDCGVACLLSIVRYYGGNTTLDFLRRKSGTNKQGTTLLGLYQAAQEFGFNSEGKEGDINSLKAMKQPLILHVLTAEKRQHYVVIYNYDGEKFLIGDPEKGIIYWSLLDLQEFWKSKTLLILTPNERFEKIRHSQKKRRQWFLGLLKPDFPLLRYIILLGIAVAVLGMALSVFSQKLIDDILPSKQMDKLIGGIGLLLLLLLVRVGLSGLRQYFLIFQSKAFNIRIIDSFYSALLHLPKPFFDTRKIGELVARLNDTSRIQRVIQQVVGNAIIDAIVVLVSLGFLYYYNWESAAIALVSLPIYFLLIYRFNKKIIDSQREVMKAYAVNESNYISTMQGITEIKNNNKQSLFKTLNQNIYGFFQNSIFSLGKIKIRLSIYSGIAAVLFMVGILAYCSYRVLNETLTLGELMAILGIVGTLLPSVTNLALLAIPINEANIAFERMHEFAGLESEEKGLQKVKKIQSISIRNASFRFPGRKQLFEDVSMEIPSNGLVALVGESGSGKSTLGFVLQKHYALEKGKILINGSIPLETIKVKNWRKKLGVVPQEITLFNGTVLDNIVLGMEQNPKKVIDFCKELGFNEFFKSFPQGYTTLLGEEGTNISGGQKQILAFARVLYKRPDVLILDEATSALDRNTEMKVLELLNKLKKKICILFITHRMHVLKHVADEIYILENKNILIKGTHDKLLLSENPYSKFWQNLTS